MSGYLALAGKSPLKTVIPVEVTKEFANSSHKLKGLTAGNVSPCFDLRMVRQRNTCMPGKKKRTSWGFGGVENYIKGPKYQQWVRFNVEKFLTVQRTPKKALPI